MAGWRALLGTLYLLGNMRTAWFVQSPRLGGGPAVDCFWVVEYGRSRPPPLGVMAQLYNFEELFTTCPYEPPRVLLALGYVSVNLAEFGQHEGR